MILERFLSRRCDDDTTIRVLEKPVLNRSREYELHGEDGRPGLRPGGLKCREIGRTFGACRLVRKASFGALEARPSRGCSAGRVGRGAHGIEAARVRKIDLRVPLEEVCARAHADGVR